MVSIPLCYEYDIHKYYTKFRPKQLMFFFLIYIRVATCLSVLNRHPQALHLDE
jgi:hypothetical protein